MSDIDKDTFEHIKRAKESGSDPDEIADDLGLDSAEVDLAFGTSSFMKFVKMRKDIGGGVTVKEETKQIYPAESGKYKALIGSKLEENGRLKDERGFLMEQVYFLRKAVRFFESRKLELERGIKMMEGQIDGAIPMIETIEETENLRTISPKTAKKNK